MRKQQKVNKLYDRFCQKLSVQGKVIDLFAQNGQFSENFLLNQFETITFLNPLGQQDDHYLQLSTWMDLARRGIVIVKKPISEMIIPYRTIDGIWISRLFTRVKRSVTAELLSQMYDWLKPGGIMALSMLEGEGQKCVKHQVQNHEKTIWQIYYQPEELQQLFQMLGYETIAAWYESDIDRRFMQLIIQRPKV